MNYSSLISKLGGAVLAAISSMLLITSAQAQPAGPNVYFDPSNSGTTNAGGSGDFSTSNFWNGSTDAPFVSGTDVPGTFIPGDGAIFNGPASTVTVSSAVNPDYLEVGVTSGTETFGTVGNEAEIDLPIGNSPSTGPNYNQPQVGPNFLTPIQVDAGSENVVFNSNVNFGIINHFYGPATLSSATTGNVAFNGGITFTNNSTGSDNVGQPNITLAATNGGSFTINSAVVYTEAPGSATVTNGNVPYVLLNQTGSTLTLTNNASFTDSYVRVSAGTVLDQGATFTSPVYNLNYPISVGGTGEFLAATAGMNITNNIVYNNFGFGNGGTIGSNVVGTTTFSGQEIVAYNGTDMDVTAGAGSRVNFTGDLHNGNGYNVVKVGVGTVALNDTQGRGEDQNGGWEIKNGTMLLNGTVAAGTSISGSQLTIDAVAHNAINANQTYATLGGIGTTNVPIVSAGGSSIIAPGDPATNGGIGTLGLLGGLTASSGVTLAFNISGATSSEINFGSAALTLGGTTNVDIVADGPVLAYNPITQTNTYYTLAVGTGTWTSNPTFNFVTPAGYVIDHVVYGPVGPGGSEVFKVELIAAPEPSTYALMGLGMLVLIATVRSRKLRA